MECSNNSIKITVIHQKKGVMERKAKTPLTMDSPLDFTKPHYPLTVSVWGAPGPMAVDHT